MFKTKKMDKDFMVNKFEQYLKEYQRKARFYECMMGSEPNNANLRHHYMRMFLRYNELAMEMDSNLRKLGVTPIYDYEGRFEKLA